ncbi:hypothetical protein [Vibrio barjaei]|uniref:hypothetical protein n=1 Tax=Vibrio barjaei TaxID=1676683 RepID=UPI002284E613|nr:hypothetical protein [Vibrio barjaei]MCY9870471.1 hypothetical protein [Vibrio barjaei]
MLYTITHKFEMFGRKLGLVNDPNTLSRDQIAKFEIEIKQYEAYEAIHGSAC